VLGIVNGVRQGGVQGDATAAIDAAQLYGAASAADVAAGGAGFAGAGALAGAGIAAVPLAMFGGMYSLFNKNSTVSPVSAYTTTMDDANMYIGQGKKILAAGGESQQAQQYAQGDINFGESLEPIAQRQLDSLNPYTGSTDQFALPPEISSTTNFSWATPGMSSGALQRHNIQQS
jgi:hypothetical protein